MLRYCLSRVAVRAFEAVVIALILIAMAVLVPLDPVQIPLA